MAEQAKQRKKEQISYICICLWSRNSRNEARAVRPRKRISGKNPKDPAWKMMV